MNIYNIFFYVFPFHSQLSIVDLPIKPCSRKRYNSWKFFVMCLKFLHDIWISNWEFIYFMILVVFQISDLKGDDLVLVLSVGCKVQIMFKHSCFSWMIYSECRKLKSLLFVLTSLLLSGHHCLVLEMIFLFPHKPLCSKLDWWLTSLLSTSQYSFISIFLLKNPSSC